MTPSAAADLPVLMGALEQRPTPALVWLGSDGGRVELSGRVLANWAAKSAHLLRDDAALEAGSDLLLDPAAHWRGAAILLAAWRLGAHVHLAPGTGPVQVAVELDRTGAQGAAAEPTAGLEQAAEQAEEHLITAYPSLAMRLPDGPGADAVRTGAVDYCAEIRMHPDDFADDASWRGATVADARQEAVALPDLLEQAARRAAELGRTPTVLLGARGLTGAAVLEALAAWLADGSVVLTDRAAGRELEDALRGERITHRLPDDGSGA